MVKNPSDTAAIRVSAEDTGSGKHGTWFRGEHTYFNPSCAQMIDGSAVDDHVLAGWLPDAPPIKPETTITAFGSCFASNISDWLSKRNFRVLNKDEDATRAYVVTMGEGMVNSFVIRQQFEWAWENKVFEQPLWHGLDCQRFGMMNQQAMSFGARSPKTSTTQSGTNSASRPLKRTATT